jgi:hypothetical protein
MFDSKMEEKKAAILKLGIGPSGIEHTEDVTVLVTREPAQLPDCGLYIECSIMMGSGHLWEFFGPDLMTFVLNTHNLVFSGFISNQVEVHIDCDNKRYPVTIKQVGCKADDIINLPCWKLFAYDTVDM